MKIEYRKWQLPGVYTQVSAVKDWIQTQLKDQDKKAIFVRQSGAVCVWEHMSVTLILMCILLVDHSFR